MSNPHTLDRLADSLRSRIGAHARLIGTGCPDTKYHEMLRESDAAVSLAKYLICHLDDRHLAVCFARRVGMPGYINLR